MKLKDLISVIPYYGGVEVYDMRDSGAPVYSCMWNEKFKLMLLKDIPKEETGGSKVGRFVSAIKHIISQRGERSER